MLPELVDVISVIRKLQDLLGRGERLSSFDMQNSSARKLHDEIYTCLDEVDGWTVNKILNDDQFGTLRDGLRLLNAQLHRATEIGLARRFLTRNSYVDPFEESWINGGFVDLLNAQIHQWRAGGVQIDGSRVAVVGGGALPQTQVFLRTQIDCEVLCIDSDPEAVELCSAVLKKLGLNQVDAVCCAGEAYDYKEVDFVVVATLVGPKTQIAAQILATAGANLYFAPRSPVRLHQMWRNPADVESIQKFGWSLVSKLEPKNSSVCSLLFRSCL